MENRIGTDLREVSESVFFGLNLRQLIAGGIGIVLSVIIWISFSERLGSDYTSWLCCAVVTPCACVGFIKIQGQPFERFALSWLRFTFLERKELSWKSELNLRLIKRKLDAIKREPKPDGKENVTDNEKS